MGEGRLKQVARAAPSVALASILFAVALRYVADVFDELEERGRRSPTPPARRAPRPRSSGR